MKPIYAELEKTIRTGPPDEAACAREQLKALRAHAPVVGSAPPFVTHLQERWTVMSVPERFAEAPLSLTNGLALPRMLSSAALARLRRHRSAVSLPGELRRRECPFHIG